MSKHHGIAVLSFSVLGAIILLLSVGFIIEQSKKETLKQELINIESLIIDEASTRDPKEYGTSCKSISACTDSISVVDCMPEVDGPLLYIDSGTGEVIVACGGACMGGQCDLDKCQEMNNLCNNKTP